MKLGSKTILLFTSVGALIIIMMSALQYLNLRDKKLQSVREGIANQLEYLDMTLTRFIQEAKNDLLTLVDNERVRFRDDRDFTNFLDADEDTFVYRITDVEREIIHIFNAFRSRHSYVNSVYMGRENGSFVRSHKRNRPTRYDPRNRPWYVLAKSHPDRVMLTPPYASVTTSDVNIGVVTALTGADGSVYGVVGMDITLNSLTDYIADFRMSYSGQMLLIDQNGMVLAARNRQKLFMNVRTLFNSDVNVDSDERCLTIHTLEGVQYVYMRRSLETGWKLMAMIPEIAVKKEIFHAVFTDIVFFTAGIILLSVCTLTGLYRYIIGPMVKLTNGIRNIQETGDLTHRFIVGSNDEIRELADAFNEMLEAISAVQKELRASQWELQQERDIMEERVRDRTLELEMVNWNLHQEIAERTQAEQAAEAANRAKSLFLANMSHEIRTPLNAVLGFTQILLRDSALSSEHRKSVETINRSGEYLLTLLNDILEMSKIEAGSATLNLDSCDLYALLSDLEAMFRVLAQKKGLFLETVKAASTPRWVRIDAQKLRQVLNNLLGNAVKFTEKGGVILRVHAEPHLPEDSFVNIWFEVEDTGPGIPEADRERIFSLFEQLTIGSRMKGGTGLGLSISKAFVELMGGTIQVDGEVGLGSIFRFSIRAETSPELSIAAQPSSRQVVGIKTDRGSIRILVADDNDANREILIQILESVGFSVYSAANGVEAVAAFQHWHPHLILMDIVMPVMDGVEAIRFIRNVESEMRNPTETILTSTPSTPHSVVPIIAVTASVLMEEQENVLAAGANAFLKKPFRQEDILQLIQDHLGVEYVYSDPAMESPAEKPFEPMPLMLSDEFPDDLRAKLWDAVVSLDIDRLQELITEAAQYQPESADRLRQWVDNYEFEKLKGLLRKGGEHDSGVHSDSG